MQMQNKYFRHAGKTLIFKLKPYQYTVAKTIKKSEKCWKVQEVAGKFLRKIP
jgi:hypothetical protein